ncbi:uncharacterized protein LOC110102440 [Dendrobium catenatum]|uniref:uncharacterized protein LOC110102440 n=1 Tax=Dendrobium catenatum TaxID=906689 RepID=UPI0010A09036|nr:uncharacterized protein LOC110102440 [Dendrobium catenatum]
MNSILFWNCRGAKKKRASLYLKEVVKDQNVLFVGLLETKLVFIEHKDMKSLIGTGWNYSFVPSAGLSGGILALWRSSLANFNMIESSSQFIVGDLDILNKGKWRVATIYGSKDVYNRRFLWNGLEKHITNDWPLVIGGDFNCLLAKEDKIGGRKFNFSLGPREMKYFMTSNDRHELNFIGPRMTWSNNKKGYDRIMERLDRILVNFVAVNCNQQMVVKHLPRIASDHCPILLNTSVFPSNSKRSIKFEDVWASYLASFDVVKKAWMRRDSGSPTEILNYKFKRALKSLFFWNKAKHKELNHMKDLLRKEILILKTKESEVGMLSMDDYSLMKFKINELNSTLTRLNTWWRQRSKVKWISEEDQISKKFHSMASARKNNNLIPCIKDGNGIMVENHNQIEDVFLQYFKDKWRDRRCLLEGWTNIHSFMDEDDKSQTNKEFIFEEVENAIKDTTSGSSPGEDDISYSFLKIYWPIIGIEFWEAMRNFFETAKMNED